MASVDFRVKNGFVTGANNTSLGTAVTVLIGGNVGINDTNPSYRLSVSGTLNSTGAMTQAGNQVLHAANYNSYTPTLTGTGASGTWGINVTGTANSVIGNIQGTINGTIAWGSGQVITSSGTNYFQLNSGSQLGVYDSAKAGYVIRANYNDHIRLVEAGGNVYVYGSRLYNDSSQQYVFQNSGNWAINAFNISQYPLNQSVLTTASPTFAGLTTTGNLVVAAGDLYSYRAGGATGVLFLNSAGSRYLYWDNSTYQMPGAELNVNGQRVLNAGNYNNYAVARVSTARNGVYKLFRNDSDSDYNVQTTWGGDRSGYWSLRGYSGDTYHAGCFVAYAGYADSAGSCPTATNATTVGGYGISIGQAASTVVVRDGSGYAFFNYINSNTGNSENPGVSQVIVTNGSDNYYRKASIGHLAAYIRDNSSGTWSINITGNAGYASSAGSVAWTNVSGRPSYLSEFINNLGNYGNYLVSGSSASLYSLSVSLGSGFSIGSGSSSANIYMARSAGSVWRIIRSVGDYIGFMNTASTGWSAVCIGDDFSVIGNVTAYASDERLKTNFTNITNAVDKVKQLGGYTFDWQIEKCKSVGFTPSNNHEHGLKAQEVQKIVADAVELAPFDVDTENGGVSKSGENYLTVKYEKMIPLLIEAIKELSDKVEKLENK